MKRINQNMLNRLNIIIVNQVKTHHRRGRNNKMTNTIRRIQTDGQISHIRAKIRENPSKIFIFVYR